MSNIRCQVRSVVGGNAWEVTFPDHEGKPSLFLQSDWDQAAFAFNCGAIPSSDPGSEQFVQLDPETITECPDDYIV